MQTSISGEKKSKITVVRPGLFADIEGYYFIPSLFFKYDTIVSDACSDESIHGLKLRRTSSPDRADYSSCYLSMVFTLQAKKFL